ncbi:metal-dependent transcriptional regulator [Pontibacter sp. 172403-2]|uniref:metal-dependent transcriptional regulator n=1 Tax=Pontibacter rufus TaxID=2791028 RepID=UPI0018AF7D53|nr:metal-dependent transcriptional regulator [Pontibacter sp. 172403-2]
MYSFTEENYIKTIYKLSANGAQEVSTNALADALDTRAASVTDMLRKLSAKNMVHYVKYRGVTLTEAGERVALQVIRKHRLWEVFLVDKLQFNWDEVHEVAEELEHVTSELLTKRLDEFLGYPRFDPHGDPIPSETGEINQPRQKLLAAMDIAETGTVVGVNDSQPHFLKYLDKIGISLGSKVKVTDKMLYDSSMEIHIEGGTTILVSSEVSNNIYLSA